MVAAPRAALYSPGHHMLFAMLLMTGNQNFQE